MSGTRKVSSVMITLAPPRRAEVTQKKPINNHWAEHQRHTELPPRTPPEERWSDEEELHNGDLPSFPSNFLDDIPDADDCLSPDLPPPPPPPPSLSPKRGARRASPLPPPPPPPPPDDLSLELQKLEMAHAESQQKAVRPQAPSLVRPQSLLTQSLLTQSPPTQSMPTQSPPTQSPPTQSLPMQSPPTQSMPTQSPPTQSLPMQCPPTTQLKKEEPAPAKQSFNGHNGKQESSEICAFCHKSILPSAAAIEAMKKQYHASCFTCRKCQRLLAGQLYYQKDGQPICEHCYKDSLEKCARCQSLILQHIVRAMGQSYHPECFRCVVCERMIADESFAVDEYNEVHCAEDYFRKYAPSCGVCEEPIIPRGSEDSYKIECLGRSYHENCYRCEKCRILLSLEPTDSGCYPLKGHLLCKPCHLSWKEELS